jgi:short-subunit dehydrogenase
MAKLDFNGRTLVVTGAARGLGRCITQRLVCIEGARVIAVDFRADELEELRKELENFRCGSCIAVATDLSTPEGVEQVIDATRDQEIFGLVNCAGITHFGNALSRNLDWYRRMIDVNFMASMQLSLIFADRFRIQGEGCILNISSIAGKLPLAYQNIYSASKHALQCFSEALQGELKGSGVTLSIYAPGGIRTAMVEESGLSDHFGRSNLGFDEPENAARKALKVLQNKKAFATSGLLENFCLAGERFLPTRWTIGMMARLYRPRAAAA